MTKNELILSGKHLVALRQYANKSPEEMANAAAVQKSTYLDWEQEKDHPDIEQFLAMAKLCGMTSVDALIEEIKQLSESYTETDIK